MDARLTRGAGPAALVAALALFCANVASAQQPQPRKPPSQQQPAKQPPGQQQQQVQAPAKAQTFLQLLDRRAPLAELREALRSARLTKEEETALGKHLQDPRYRQALEQAGRQAMAGRAARRPRPQPRVGPTVQELRQGLHRDHAALVARLEAEAQPVLQQARATATRPAPAPRLAPSAMVSLGTARAPTNPSRVNIQRLDPEVATAGNLLRILGRDMGSAGQVTIIVGAEDPRPENAFVCPVIAWNSQDIMVTVPRDLEELHRAHPFPNGRRSALLWVKPRNDPSGRTLQFEVSVDLRRFAPGIETISPTQLTPGLRFGIRGQNLSAGSRPTVELHVRVGTDTFRRSLQVIWSSDTYVEAYVPDDISGLPSNGQATVVVGTGIGTSRPQPTNFVPVEDVVTFAGEPSSACCMSIVDSLVQVLILQDLLFDSTTGCYQAIFLCTWGEKKTSRPFEHLQVDDGMFRRQVGTLINGWTVADATVSEVSYDDSSGCYFDSAPRAGGTEFTGAEMVAWANAGGSVKCLPSLVIRGPRGLAYNARP